jgi:hypothetical protein
LINWMALRGAGACELTIRGTPLGATTGRSQASAPRFSVLSPAFELAALVGPQGCLPAKPARPAGGPVATSGQPGATSWEDHEFRNPLGPTCSERRKRRRAVYELRDGLRRLSAPRVAGCGRKRIAFDVEVVRKKGTQASGGSSQYAYFRGVGRCGSVWECPACAVQIRAQRAEELKFAVEQWGGDTVVMLSLTVRHDFADDLCEVRRGLANSFRRLINGNPWKRFSREFGLLHHVRSIEVTHGANGWHPHLHILFFLDGKLTEAELTDASAQLEARWASCVRAALGREFVPNEHGVDLRKCKKADYLAKLSFELSDPGTKKGRGKNRTPLQIAASAASGKCEADDALWMKYCEGMRGAKMLTWSRGLREFVGLDQECTDEAAADTEEGEPSETVTVIAGEAWDAARHKPGVACAILDTAELVPNPTEAADAIGALVHRAAAQGTGQHWRPVRSRVPP